MQVIQIFIGYQRFSLNKFNIQSTSPNVFLGLKRSCFKQVQFTSQNIFPGLPPRPPDHPASGPGVPHLLDLHDHVPLNGEVPGGLQPPAQGEQHDLF